MLRISVETLTTLERKCCDDFQCVLILGKALLLWRLSLRRDIHFCHSFNAAFGKLSCTPYDAWLLKLIDNSLRLNKGNHDGDGLWIYDLN